MLEQSADRIYKNKQFSNLKEIYNIDINETSFNQIKVQLKALGLIKLSEKKHSPSDNFTYWTLTPYGEYIMMQILAVKKKN